ncbi:DNA helicase [Bertholletia excelsa]
MKSFVFPLIEEVRADLCSSMLSMSRALTCKVLSIEISEEYKPPKDLFYYMEVERVRDDRNDGGECELETGDLIAITDVQPKCIDDFSGCKNLYMIALVQRVREKKDCLKLQILASRCLVLGLGLQCNGKKQTFFTVVLANMTTYMHIWNALNSRLNSGNKNVIEEVLQHDCAVNDNCTLCSTKEKHRYTRSTLCAVLHSFGLNYSQEEAILKCIATKDCYHQNTAKLIWGPPGTGKTKTIGVLLYVLLGMKCRTLTCAPTNIAVLEVTKRLLQLVMGSNEYGIYGLGDIVLFGNMKRMKIEDHDDLLNVFLDHRAKILVECFAPLSGWRHCLGSMISLLGDPEHQYHLYFLNEEQNKRRLTFKDFVTKEFKSLQKKIEHFAANLCTHLPTCFISPEMVETMIGTPSWLECLGSLLCSTAVSGEQLKEIHNKSEYGGEQFSGLSELSKLKSKCLQMLRSISEEILFPEIYDVHAVKRFCLDNTCLLFCMASSSVRLDRGEIMPMELLIVDEAAQLKECESIIPHIHHAILIGDEQQLPALVKSKICEEAEFGRSLFQRLVLVGHRKHLLNIQYRMHPSISLFPNKEFYNNQVLDAPNVKDKSYRRTFLQNELYGSYTFINVAFGNELTDGYSLKNMVEVAVVSDIVARLFTLCVASKQRISIGVISPYTAQVAAIQEALGTTYGTDVRTDLLISVRTVDGFQGGEKDVIIISTVRSNGNGSVGFLSNQQRVNVALTRARYCLWIVGNGSTLRNSGTIWKKLVGDAKAQRCFHNAEEDKNLSLAITAALVDVDLLDIQLYKDSLLFRGARWKVYIDDKFWKSMEKIKNIEIRKESLALLTKLSKGWRLPHKQGSLVSMGRLSTLLLECYEIHGLLHLLWTVDIIEHNSKRIQVLKVFDILHLADILKLRRNLDLLFGRYTVEVIWLCKFRCMEGN